MPVNTKQVIYKENGQQVQFSPETNVESLVTSSSGTGNLLVTDGSGGVTISQKSTSSFYELPSGGIPKTDLSSEIQNSLSKADSALQSAPVTSVNGQTGAVLIPMPVVPVQDVTVGGTSVVSNGTAVIPQEVFIGTYNVTTASDFEAALSAGKVVFCKNGDACYTYVNKSGGYLFFSLTTQGTGSSYLRLKISNNQWLLGNFNLENVSNKVTSFQTTPDDTHYPSEKLVKDSLDTKIDNTDVEALTAIDIDNTPTANSSNLVTSGGVYTALSSKEDNTNKVTALSSSSTDTQYPSAKCAYDNIHPAIVTTQPVGGFEPNIVYQLGTITGTVTFLLASPSDNNIANYYYWSFDSGSTAPTITWPSGITWIEGSAPTINASKHYEISVINSIASCLSDDNQGGGSGITDVTVGGTSVVTNGVAVIPAIPTVPTISTNINSDKTSNTKTASPKAVYDEVHPAIESSQPVGGFLPNVMYNLGTITGTVTFAMASAGDLSIVNHWYWTFDTDTTAPTVTWPQEITSWLGGSAPTINASKHYEISVLNGIGVAMEV